jgi:hypothetical protein
VRVSRDGKLDRESELRFDRVAPPVVPIDFELPNGDADVEIELSSADAVGSVKAHVDLEGKETTIEAGGAL